MANPTNYTQNVGFPSIISGRAMDYMKLCNEPKIDSPMYVMFLKGGLSLSVKTFISYYRSPGPWN